MTDEPQTTNYKLDELTDYQLSVLWRNRSISAEDAISSMKREGTFYDILMEIITAHLERTRKL